MIAQSLHWLVAGLVLVQIGLGLYAAGLPVSLARLQWLSRHKSLGLAILALMLVRLVWRWLNPPPAMPESMPRWQRSAAATTHGLLYLLLVLTALSGWMHASAAGLSINWFGLVLVPDLVPKQAELSELMKAVHAGCVAALALLLAGHVSGAFYHALVLRDGVIGRMLPWKARRTT